MKALLLFLFLVVERSSQNVTTTTPTATTTVPLDDPSTVNACIFIVGDPTVDGNVVKAFDQWKMMLVDGNDTFSLSTNSTILLDTIESVVHFSQDIALCFNASRASIDNSFVNSKDFIGICAVDAPYPCYTGELLDSEKVLSDSGSLGGGSTCIYSYQCASHSCMGGRCCTVDASLCSALPCTANVSIVIDSRCHRYAIDGTVCGVTGECSTSILDCAFVRNQKHVPLTAPCAAACTRSDTRHACDVGRAVADVEALELCFMSEEKGSAFGSCAHACSTSGTCVVPNQSTTCLAQSLPSPLNCSSNECSLSGAQVACASELVSSGALVASDLALSCELSVVNTDCASVACTSVALGFDERVCTKHSVDVQACNAQGACNDVNVTSCAEALSSQLTTRVPGRHCYDSACKKLCDALSPFNFNEACHTNVLAPSNSPCAEALNCTAFTSGWVTAAGVPYDGSNAAQIVNCQAFKEMFDDGFCDVNGRCSTNPRHCDALEPLTAQRTVLQQCSPGCANPNRCLPYTLRSENDEVHEVCLTNHQSEHCPPVTGCRSIVTGWDDNVCMINALDMPGYGWCGADGQCITNCNQIPGQFNKPFQVQTGDARCEHVGCRDTGRCSANTNINMMVNWMHKSLCLVAGGGSSCAPKYCSAGGACKPMGSILGTVCTDDSECGSFSCSDEGRCCDAPNCDGECRTCIRGNCSPKIGAFCIGSSGQPIATAATCHRCNNAGDCVPIDTGHLCYPKTSVQSCSAVVSSGNRCNNGTCEACDMNSYKSAFPSPPYQTAVHPVDGDLLCRD